MHKLVMYGTTGQEYKYECVLCNEIFLERELTDIQDFYILDIVYAYKTYYL